MSNNQEYTEGYMLFAAEAPMIGLDPQPAYAPNSEVQSLEQYGWAQAYSVNENRAELEAEAKDDHEHRLQEVEAGNLEDADDMDVVLPVKVFADGSVEVFHEGESGELLMFRIYTAEDMYTKAFGMEVPIAPGASPAA